MKTNLLSCQVIMLPTDKASHLYIQNNKVCYDETIVESVKNCNDQHLYLVSDEDIKDGRTNFYTYDDLNNNILHIDYIQYFGQENNGKGDVRNGRASFKTVEGTSSGTKHKEIIASTDTSLNLPQIPQSFIEAYVKSNGTIKEVGVEIEIGVVFKKTGIGPKQMFDVFSIKTIANNEVIVHLPEVKTYTKDEVIKFTSEVLLSCDSLTTRVDGYREINFTKLNKLIQDNL